MVKSTSRKTPIRRKTSKKKKSSFSYKSILFFLFLIGILFSAYHYRSALSFYFKSQSNENNKVDKVAQARIYQILKAHRDLTFGIDVSQFQGEINWDEFWTVVKGNGPCNKARIAAKIKSHEEGAWVREAANAHAEKNNKTKAA